nr:immunoglobulin heavy chain junction region [Mus musculus]
CARGLGRGYYAMDYW